MTILREFVALGLYNILGTTKFLEASKVSQQLSFPAQWRIQNPNWLIQNPHTTRQRSERLKAPSWLMLRIKKVYGNDQQRRSCEVQKRKGEPEQGRSSPWCRRGWPSRPYRPYPKGSICSKDTDGSGRDVERTR